MIKAFGWLKFIGCVSAATESHFKGRICFFPGEGVTVPKVAHPDLYGYLGILDNLEVNLPFPRPSTDFTDLDIVRGWLKNCTESHRASCQPDDTGKLQDLTVIDCERLLICPAPEKCAYIALSYVWGPPSEFAEENYVFPSIPSQRARTIEDAISVTKRLGYRYLWVDRYCINQNDSEHKMKQIRQMGAIYSSADLTIVAAAGNGPKHGLPGISLPRRVPMPWGQVVGSVALVLTTVSVVEEVYNTTWAYRAWTFQEGYLSRRRLFFTDSTMLYVCNEDMRADIAQQDYMLGDIHGQRMLQLFVPWDSPMPAQDDWNVQSKNLNIAGRHMKAFSERRLTYDSDALNAILGILNHLSVNDEDPVYHIWGVPLALYRRDQQGPSTRNESYEIALNWYHEGPCNRRPGFPTWSSIAWDGSTQYSYQDQMMVADEVDLHIVSSGGSLSLEEYVKSGQVLQDSGSPKAPTRLELMQASTIPIKLAKINENDVGATFQLTNDLDVISYVSLDQVGQALDLTFLALVIYRDYSTKRMSFIVLAKSGTFYERVGFSMLDEDDIQDYQFKNSHVRDRKTGKSVVDAQYLKQTLETPVKFIEEQKQNIILA